MISTVEHIMNETVKRPEFPLTDAEIQEIRDAAATIDRLSGKLGDDFRRPAGRLYEATCEISSALSLLERMRY